MQAKGLVYPLSKSQRHMLVAALNMLPDEVRYTRYTAAVKQLERTDTEALEAEGKSLSYACLAFILARVRSDA